MLSRSFSVMSKPTLVLNTNFTPSALDQLDFAIEHAFRQPVFRQRVAQHAAGLGVRVVDRDVVPEQRQVEGARSARWDRRRRRRPSCRSVGSLRAAIRVGDVLEAVGR